MHERSVSRAVHRCELTCQERLSDWLRKGETTLTTKSDAAERVLKQVSRRKSVPETGRRP
jgi:hypothetical protein